MTDTKAGRNTHKTKSRLLASCSPGILSFCILAASLAMAPSAAQAANECGAPAGGQVTCAPDAGNYPNGVSYMTPDLTVTLQDGVSIVTASEDGISLFGGVVDGDFTLTTAPGATVSISTTGNDNEGVSIFTRNGDIDVILGLQDITTTGGASDGLELLTALSGDIFVNVTGTISTQGQNARGVRATTPDGNIDITVNDIMTAGIGSDGAHGVEADAMNGGQVSITATGNIVTTGDGARGVTATTIDTGAITLRFTGDINSADYGVHAMAADGLITLVTTGAINTTGDSADGIFTRSAAGDIVIASTGPITASGAGSKGVFGGTANGGSIRISVADVTTSGGTVGITGTPVAVFAQTDNGGSISVTTSGALETTGDNGQGVQVSVLGDGDASVTTMGSITTAGVLAHGIQVGLADKVDVTATGPITTTGRRAYGILLDGPSGVATIDASGAISTTGDDAGGVKVEALGAAAVNITTTGAINTTGDDADSIFAQSASGDIVTASTGSISTSGARSRGVTAATAGGGNISVTVADISTSGIDTDAVFASTVDGDISISATGAIAVAGLSVSTGISGVRANSTSGDISINVNDINVTGISAVPVSATTASTGKIDVTVNGTVTGGVQGILAISSEGSTIVIESGASVQSGFLGIATSGAGSDIVRQSGQVSGSAIAISTGEGDDEVFLNSGSTTSGVVDLGLDDDTLFLATSSFTKLLGAAGIDELNFTGAIGAINNSGASSDSISGFETLNFNASGTTLAGVHQGYSAANFNTGTNTLTGDLMAANVNIGAAGALIAGDGASITGNLDNAGHLDLSPNMVGGFTINGDYTEDATGFLVFDVIAGTSADLLTVTGDVALGGDITLRQNGFANGILTLLDGQGAISGSFADIVGLGGVLNGLAVQQLLIIDATNSDVLLSTTIADPTTIGLSPNATNTLTSIIGYAQTPVLAPTLTPTPTSTPTPTATPIPTPIAVPALSSLAHAVVGLSTINTLTAALNEVHPEIIDAGIKTIAMSQFSFVNDLLDQSASSPHLKPQRTASLTPVYFAGEKNGPRAWVSIGYRSIQQDGDGSNIDFDADGLEFTIGVSDIETGPVSWGAAIGYADFNSDDGGTQEDDADTRLLRIGLHGHIGVNENGRGLNGQLDGAISFADIDSAFIQRVSIPGSGIDYEGESDTNGSSFNGSLRYKIDGMNGDKWPVRPFALIAGDVVKQDGFIYARGTAGELAVEEFDRSRGTVGAGLEADFTLGRKTNAGVRVTGLRHFGDTENVLVSTFTAAGTTAIPFTTIGQEIRTQGLIEAAVARSFNSGFEVSFGGSFAFGDLRGATARGEIAKRF